ncbi:MAG: GAF domain-containing sensor histidine kinase [Microthrixaceae bacterium]
MDANSLPSSPPSDAERLDLAEAVDALRSLPFGGIDDATRNFALPPSIRAGVSPALATFRWGAVGFGIVFAAPEAFRGSYVAVLTVAVCVFITTWRTVIPIRLASTRFQDRFVAFGDVVIIGLAVGAGGGLESPFIFSLLAAMVVMSFGWGYLAGSIAVLTGAATMMIALPLGLNTYTQQADSQRDLGLTLMMIFVVTAASFVRGRLLDSEVRRGSLAGQVDSLNDANNLLSLVNSIARTLPTSLSLREALEASRQQLEVAFDTRRICLVVLDERSDEWVPKLADGCVLNPAYRTAALPEPLSAALGSATPVLRDALGLTTDLIQTTKTESTSEAQEFLSSSSQSGLYVRLETRGNTVGILGLEHPEKQHFQPQQVQLLSGMAEVLALTIDNARWFGRLRTLGAQEERIRLARDLHDRLGQWLTYISFELERIMGNEPEQAEELAQLYADVQAALDELRETLRQLRSGVSEEQPLAMLGRELVARFAERSDLSATFNVTRPEERLTVPVENELLRILQEALNNVAKHARATFVSVTWDVNGGNFQLEVADDGQGFEVARGVRDSSYGLVGMRERADVIGADLTIESSPGSGTVLRVFAGNSDRRSDSSKVGSSESRAKSNTMSGQNLAANKQGVLR